MNRHEKLILLLVAIFTLSLVANFGKEIAEATCFGTAPISPSDKAFLKSVTVLIFGLVNVGAAIWLGIEARAAALRSWVWALFGLCFGLWAIALFYLVQLYVQQRKA